MKIKKIRQVFPIFMTNSKPKHIDTSKPKKAVTVKVVETPVQCKEYKKAIINSIGENTTEVINVNGDKTLITITQKEKGSTKGFVVHIHRTYIKGGEHEEPDHFWLNQMQAKMDAKDWVDIAKMTDW